MKSHLFLTNPQCRLVYGTEVQVQREHRKTRTRHVQFRVKLRLLSSSFFACPATFERRYIFLTNMHISYWKRSLDQPLFGEFCPKLFWSLSTWTGFGNEHFYWATGIGRFCLHFWSNEQKTLITTFKHTSFIILKLLIAKKIKNKASEMENIRHLSWR